MKIRVLSVIGLVTVYSAAADAHVSVVSGNAVANVTQVVRFGIGHGCSGADTVQLQVEIPAGVTSVRPMTSDFGRSTVQTDAAGVVTAVTWQRDVADVLPSDTNYYEVGLRLKPPNAPFTSIYFRAHQTCRSGDGGMTTVDWVALPGATTPDGGAAPEPAAVLNLVPAHLPGWNSFTLTAAISTLSTFFSDASIVWRGSAAYSINPSTTALISTTPGVTALTSLASGDRIWVRY
jgi:periplasmic copper chaperone A